MPCNRAHKITKRVTDPIQALWDKMTNTALNHEIPWGSHSMSRCGRGTIRYGQRHISSPWTYAIPAFHQWHHCQHQINSKTYTTLIQPTLEYAGPVWDSHERTNIDTHEKIQWSAAGVEFNKPHRCTVENQECHHPDQWSGVNLAWDVVSLSWSPRVLSTS